MAANRDADPNDPTDPTDFSSRSLGYQVNLLARTMEQALAARIRPYGVVPGQFAQLLALYRSDGQSVTDLASTVAIEHSTMSRTLKRMERDGLVVTRPNPDDGRSRRIYLTDHARGMESALKAEAEAVNREFLAGLSSGQGEELVTLLKAIVAAAPPRPDEASLAETPGT